MSTVRIWEASYRSSVAHADGAYGVKVLSVSWSPDGSKIVSGDW